MRDVRSHVLLDLSCRDRILDLKDLLLGLLLLDVYSSGIHAHARVACLLLLFCDHIFRTPLVLVLFFSLNFLLKGLQALLLLPIVLEPCRETW